MNRFLWGDIENLVAALKKTDKVTRLDLSGHHMRDDGAKLLAPLLEDNSKQTKANHSFYAKKEDETFLLKVQDATTDGGLKWLAVGGVCVAAGALSWPLGLSVGIMGALVGDAKAVLDCPFPKSLEIVDG